ncbi:MAG: MerR family transcriptional regulator [Ignavibacterium sp.]|nr:MerR family transcriptional regulator [Ignavibacterium sp.]MCX7611091.1 MerR family transcriptional regulator [Ignavibacterium sp.]MDW8374380.1 MerR family transcriptional regulator [Ignavibacteriales bacterium]
MFRDNLEQQPKYPIRKAAELLKISVHTLRMYEKEGLIIPFKKKSGQRLYSEIDIDRINCIRKTINEEKVSIEGIKKTLSMIPCWSIINCSESERNNCSAFKTSTDPCWNFKHKNNTCASRSCRDCIVYKEFSNCQTIKNKIIELTIEKNIEEIK